MEIVEGCLEALSRLNFTLENFDLLENTESETIEWFKLREVSCNLKKKQDDIIRNNTKRVRCWI